MVCLMELLGSDTNFAAERSTAPAGRAGGTANLDSDPKNSAFLPNFAKSARLTDMTTMNISLPDGLKAYVDELVQTEGYGTSSEYVRELIRRDQDRRQFKEHLLLGMRSGIEGPMDAAFFASLRQRATSTPNPG